MRQLGRAQVETPAGVAARVRFAKYRGLKSWRTSAWDAKEGLPREYARIFAFQNPRRMHKRCGLPPPLPRLDAWPRVNGRSLCSRQCTASVTRNVFMERGWAIACAPALFERRTHTGAAAERSRPS